MPNIFNVDNPVQHALASEFVNKKMVKIDLQTDLFDNITFPSLPYNFQMLMTDIDFPGKAQKNPNGTLFMRPQKIDTNSADDIGLQCFDSDFSVNKKSRLKATMNPDAFESLGYTLTENVLDALVEDSADMTGSDIKVRSIDQVNDRMTTLSTNAMQAITTYVSRSISVISPIIQMVGGSQQLRQVKKTIEQANSAAWSNVKEWLLSQNPIDKDQDKRDREQERRKLEKARDVSVTAMNMFSCISISQIPYNGAQKNQYLVQVSRDLNVQYSETQLDRVIIRYVENMDLKKFEKAWGQKGEPFAVKLRANTLDEPSANANPHTTPSESLNYVGPTRLTEAEDGDSESEATKTLVDYDKVYTDMYNTISSAISEAIGPRAEWTCVKDLAQQMKVLKDRADAEITKKIELVCKTGGQKSLVHWPFKAEGLLTMWSRYSAELQNRIDNRIAQIVGSNGSVETGSANMVEDFLRVTYPQIISVLLTYRCVFGQIAGMYKGNFVPYYSFDDIEAEVNAAQAAYHGRIQAIVDTYDQNNSTNP